MEGRKYSNKDNKKGNMKRSSRGEPSFYLKGLAALDRGMSRLLTGQVANTNVQKAYKRAGGK